MHIARLVALVLFAVLFVGQNAHAVYDAGTGRWLQRDPAGYVDGPSLYQLTRSNPIRYVDPIGRKAKNCNDCAVEVIGTPAFGTDGLGPHLCIELIIDGIITAIELGPSQPPKGWPKPIGKGPVVWWLGGSAASCSRGEFGESTNGSAGGNAADAWGIFIADGRRCGEDYENLEGVRLGIDLPEDKERGQEAKDMGACKLADCLRNAAKEIAQRANNNIAYNPLCQNSNSFVAQVLRSCQRGDGSDHHNSAKLQTLLDRAIASQNDFAPSEPKRTNGRECGCGGGTK